MSSSDLVETRECADTRDEELSLQIHNAVWPNRAATVAEVHSFKRAARDYAEFLASVEGVDVGSAFIAVLPQRPELPLVGLTVLAEKRGLGAGSALYAEVSRWAAARGFRRVQTRVEEDDAASLAYAQRRGFVEIERNSRMVLDLESVEMPPEAPEAPEGVEIVTWAERPELARGIYEVAVEAYADVPGAEEEEMEPFEEWLDHDMRGSADKPEATFVALAGDEVVGYAKFHLTDARPDAAFHDMTGVKRAWRGRGIAGALKAAQIAWARRSGYRLLETGPEVRNEPIRRLNRRLGYRLAPGRILLEGPVLPSA